MDYMRLGISDLQISRIGFGCAAIGGYDYGSVDERDSITAVQRALEQGVNFFDTADVYGFGHSEKILSKALGSNRKKVVIATKFGLKWDQRGRVTRDSSYNRVFEAIDNSLRRLKVDSISLYQVHWPDPDTPIQETFEALLTCQKAGKIQHIGCSNFGKRLIETAQKYGRLESLQAAYNVLDRRVENEVFSCCNSFRMAFLSHTSLARGLLSGKYNPEHNFVGTDTRNDSHYFSKEFIFENQKVLFAIKEIAEKQRKTTSQVAIRWIMDNPFVACAVVGFKNSDQVDDILRSINWDLPLADFDRLSKG